MKLKKDSPLIAGIIGALIGSFITGGFSFFLAEYKNTLRQENEIQAKKESYVSVLNTTFAFINFYNGYYKQIHNDLDRFSPNYNNVPTKKFAITLAPEVLHECITKLIGFDADSTLIRYTLGCYHDMKHLQNESKLYLDYIFTDYKHITLPGYEARVKNYHISINQAMVNSDTTLVILKDRVKKEKEDLLHLDLSIYSEHQN